MPKFMLLYKGQATDMSKMTEEQQKAVMDKWGAWMGKVGTALADIGAPLGQATSVVDNGSAGTPAAVSGYSIVEADNLEAAKALTNGHPFLSDNDGNYAIDIYEMMPVPM
jgi:hypothetical protein